MAERVLRLMCAAAVTASVLLTPAPALGAPDPSPDSGRAPDADRTLSDLLTDLRGTYRRVEQATETYNVTAEQLKKRQAEAARLDGQLTRARLALEESRRAAGLLARQQYRNSMEISSYVRLLMARNPQPALDQGHVIAQLAQERAEQVRDMTDAEKRAAERARAAHKTLDAQRALTDRQRKERDDDERRLSDIENRLASLSPGQLATLTDYERAMAETARQRLLAHETAPAAQPGPSGDSR
ncbi:coiled-coil domain-containing protein [Streptomyces sp. NPDC001222]|uniref:coiled-coil domain-containing protein n=1 Tax=Streptomyces sp. NPDC001222 TaxID=3364548 RepID=UPI0036CB59A4